MRRRTGVWKTDGVNTGRQMMRAWTLSATLWKGAERMVAVGRSRKYLDKEPPDAGKVDQ